jgi:hypothetical protein
MVYVQALLRLPSWRLRPDGAGRRRRPQAVAPGAGPRPWRRSAPPHSAAGQADPSPTRLGQLGGDGPAGPKPGWSRAKATTAARPAHWSGSLCGAGALPGRRISSRPCRSSAAPNGGRWRVDAHGAAGDPHVAQLGLDSETPVDETVEHVILRHGDASSSLIWLREGCVASLRPWDVPGCPVSRHPLGQDSLDGHQYAPCRNLAPPNSLCPCAVAGDRASLVAVWPDWSVGRSIPPEHNPGPGCGRRFPPASTRPSQWCPHP